MNITSAKFIKGVVGPADILDDGTPQIAFIGRSNAGKSSLLNSLTNSKKLAITSKTPGRTREINVFLINNTHYFMDLPGYGYAKAGGDTIEKISDLISWYLFESDNQPKKMFNWSGSWSSSPSKNPAIVGNLPRRALINVGDFFTITLYPFSSYNPACLPEAPESTASTFLSS